MKEYVLTLTAVNRVGILAAVSNAIAELGGDLREINVTVMSGFFTIILAAEFPESRDAAIIVDHLRDIGRPYGLEVVINDLQQEPRDPETEHETATFYLTLTGRNEKGLLRRIAARMARDGIDISDLHAVRDDNGTYRMLLELAVPAGVDMAELTASMESISKLSPTTADLQTAAEFHESQARRPLRLGDSVL